MPIKRRKSNMDIKVDVDWLSAEAERTLMKKMAKKYPNADIYSSREVKRKSKKLISKSWKKRMK